jgi:hypothetical protein
MLISGKYYMLSLIGIIGGLFVYSQLNAQEWPKVYGDYFDATISTIEESYDHGFLLAAYTYTSSGWPLNMWVIKIDINGNILWEKQFGDVNYSNGITGSKITIDNGMILAASTSKYSGNYDPTFIKTDACGEIEWCQVFTSPDHNYGTGIIQLFDESYIGMLQYYGEGETYARINLVKMDQYGEPIWIQRLAQEDTLIYNEEGGYLYLLSDSNYLVSGECFHPGLKAFWIKADTSGNQIWDLMWQGGISAAYQVAESSNGFLYSAGGFKSAEYHITPSIFKFDLDGNPLYQKYLFGDTLVGGGADPIIIIDDTILVTGMNWSVSIYVDVGFSEIMKTDTLGNIKDRRILIDEVRPPKTIIFSEDRKILVGGNYVTDGNWDIYLWKMNENLEDDTLYTQPLTYDSLCPYEIQSDTVDLDCGVFVNIDELPTKEEYESTIKIYPNPAMEWAVLTLPDMLASGELELVVYDIFGRAIGTGRKGEEEKRGTGEEEKRERGEYLPANRMLLLDVASYPAGMYVAVAVDRKGRRYTGKFVVAR